MVSKLLIRPYFWHGTWLGGVQGGPRVPCGPLSCPKKQNAVTPCRTEIIEVVPFESKPLHVYILPSYTTKALCALDQSPHALMADHWASEKKKAWSSQSKDLNRRGFVSHR